MNLSPRWVEFLVAAGHDATHWVHVGVPDAPDRELLSYATEHSLVLLTQDLDFGTLLALEDWSTSVIQIRAQAVLPSDIGGRILAAIDAARPHMEAGVLVTVEPSAHRLTILPINP